jgi:hypothetical protein
MTPSKEAIAAAEKIVKECSPFRSDAKYSDQLLPIIQSAIDNALAAERGKFLQMDAAHVTTEKVLADEVMAEWEKAKRLRASA